MAVDDPVPGNLDEIFPARLRSARELRDISQAELAQKAGKAPSSIAHFEIGSRKPSLQNFLLLADALEVAADYLIGRVDAPALAKDHDPIQFALGNLPKRDRELALVLIDALSQRSG